MADNEHPPPGPSDGPGGAQHMPPAGPPGPPEPGGELSVRPPGEPVPANPPPPPIDPEAVRQFQQFQQFQELLRQQQEQGFQQGTPPPPGFLQPWGPPPPRRPLWQRALRTIAGKLVTAAVVALLLAGIGYFAIDYFFGGPPDQPPAHETGGGKAEDTPIFEENPRSAVQAIYDDIAQGDPTSACDRFTAEARAQFADHLAQFGGSCEDIVTAINAGVVRDRMKNEYANPDHLSAVVYTPTSESVSVSSCALGVRGGPPLGMFTLEKIPNSAGSGQWIVTGHEAESGACAQTPTTPPSR